MSRQQGDQIEQRALEYLLNQGLKLIAQNYHCRRGEIDLIMEDNHTLVFIEVRYRKSAQYGNAAESVDFRKQQKIITTAQHFLQTHNQFQKLPCRFDVIACHPEHVTGQSQLAIQWINNAFQE